MVIYGVYLLNETPKAWLVSWYDTNYHKRVQAWVPKSITHLENGMLFLDKNIYNTLKIK